MCVDKKFMSLALPTDATTILNVDGETDLLV